MAIWFSGALGRMSKGRELRSNVATWLRPEAFKIRPNYWVNGEAESLTDGVNASEATSVFVR